MHPRRRVRRRHFVLRQVIDHEQVRRAVPPHRLQILRLAVAADQHELQARVSQRVGEQELVLRPFDAADLQDEVRDAELRDERRRVRVQERRRIDANRSDRESRHGDVEAARQLVQFQDAVHEQQVRRRERLALQSIVVGVRPKLAASGQRRAVGLVNGHRPVADRAEAGGEQFGGGVVLERARHGAAAPHRDRRVEIDWRQHDGHALHLEVGDLSRRGEDGAQIEDVRQVEAARVGFERERFDDTNAERRERRGGLTHLHEVAAAEPLALWVVNH